MRTAYKFYPGQLMDRIFDPETSMSMSMNLMVLPHVCLILRNVEEWTGKTSLNLGYVSIACVTLGLCLRYALKLLFLRKGMNKLKKR